MNRTTFYIVDVFAEQKYAGNQLAVFRDAAVLTGDGMQKPHNDLSVRVFVDYYGVPEDPAAGSGNGCLAGFLVKHRGFGGETVDLRAEQGYEIGRPSLPLLRAQRQGASIDVKVGGKSQIVAQGMFL